ncbi:hypothetical protein MMC14_008040 [Varicellaria rhodocarpa]|nr:hypothetical protein [Varicellaria rhodocarpa]
MPERRSLRSRTSLTAKSSPPPLATTMSRPRRTVSGTANPAITVARTPSQSPDNSKKSIHLTVKMSSSKLREATSVGQKKAGASSRGSFEPAEIIRGSRGSRAKRPIVEESGSEDDEKDDDEDEEQPSEAEAEAEDEEIDPDADDLEDAEGESEDADADADGDVTMEDPSSPPPPIFRVTGLSSKPVLTVTPAPAGKLKSVEAKHMQVGNHEADEDEDLSELDSDAEVNDEEGEEEDAEGEDIVEEEGGDEDQEMDEESDGETPAADGSRGSTPDVTKMTKRQRSRLDQVMGSDFLQLPMEPQIKKHLTAEEHAMRRAEMARRRKNLSEKRNEEEKFLPSSLSPNPISSSPLLPTNLSPLSSPQMDTINRLLKKQAPKRRGKLSAVELASSGPHPLAEEHSVDDQAIEYEKPNPIFVRWISDASGSRIGVPEEWLGQGVGRVFEGGLGGGRMVEEVEG